MRVRDVDFAKYVVEWPEVLDRSTTMCHDNQGSFSAQVIDKKVEKSVNGKCFIYVSDRVNKLSSG